ncbi:CHAP domain-containing protein [Sphingobium faniae]|nr:CHAP domain-containing protein [Sphingobium faniae]
MGRFSIWGRMMFLWIRWAAALLLSGAMAAPVLAATALQCVPYARIVSGVQIYGDALTWWDQAESRYRRGHAPRKGAVLAFRPTEPMALGHVAVVSQVLGERRILIRHANWSAPGAIEEDVMAVDVSPAGDWSEVRVWHSPTGQMGARINPTFGFIYGGKEKLHPFTPDPDLGTSVRLASAGQPASGDGRVPARTAVSHLVLDDTQLRRAVFAEAQDQRRRARGPRLASDPRVLEYADASLASRSLHDIINDVKQEARLR